MRTVSGSHAMVVAVEGVSVRGVRDSPCSLASHDIQVESAQIRVHAFFCTYVQIFVCLVHRTYAACGVPSSALADDGKGGRVRSARTPPLCRPSFLLHFSTAGIAPQPVVRVLVRVSVSGERAMSRESGMSVRGRLLALQVRETLFTLGPRTSATFMDELYAIVPKVRQRDTTTSSWNAFLLVLWGGL